MYESAVALLTWPEAEILSCPVPRLVLASQAKAVALGNMKAKPKPPVAGQVEAKLKAWAKASKPV
ncbi:MAG: hypothetical protein ACPGOY_04720 [Rhodospirillaceae bacterium]